MSEDALTNAKLLSDTANKLRANGRLYDAGMKYSEASVLYDKCGNYSDAHECEDMALWCLRDICAHYDTDHASIALLRINKLATAIEYPDLDKVSRHYA